jgi:dynactin-4
VNAPPPNHHLHIPTQHFTVSALKDAWAYDEEEEDEDLLPGLEGSEGLSEEGSTLGTLGRKSRKSVLGSGSLRDKKRGEAGVEKKGNISKVGLEIEVFPGASGAVKVSIMVNFSLLQFDLEIRCTYRAEETSEKENKSKHEEYKVFTYWVRVHVGDIVV